MIYKASFSRVAGGGLNRLGNDKRFVGVVLKGDAGRLFPPNVIHKRISKAFDTKQDAIDHAQKYIDNNIK